MFSRFFIDRPIFAAVISIFIVLAGLAAMRVAADRAVSGDRAAGGHRAARSIPAPPPRCSSRPSPRRSRTQINGVEDMLYMSSTSSSNGVVQIQVTFEIGTDVDKAALNVNNRVKQVEPRLPQEVRRQGVTVEKGSLGVPAGDRVLLARRPLRRPVHLELRDAQRARRAEARARHDQRADLRRQGLRDAHLAAARPDGAARPHARRRRSARVNEQNAQFAAGKVGQRPTGGAQELVYTDHDARAASPSRRSSRTSSCAPTPTARALRLKDVARVELGSQGLRLHRPRQRQAGDAGRRLPAARRQRARRREATCKRTMAELAKRFPAGPRLRGAVRHHALRRGVDPRGGEHAASRRWCSCSWWCSSSCRAGARR